MSDDMVDEFLFDKSVFKDETTLFPEYIPDKLPSREKEIQRLAGNFRPLFAKEGSSFSVNVAVVGRAGVGKTATVKYFGDRIEKVAAKKGMSVVFQYYNCHTHRKKTSILRHLLTERYNISARGFSDEEILEMLIKRLEKADSRLIIALDEANILSSEEILSIIHAPEFFGGRSRISTILIARPTEYATLLDAPLSGHIHDQIDFSGYNMDSLLEIFQYRVDLAFYPGAISSDIIAMTAEIASQTKNARHGIEIMLRAGKKADYEKSDHITPEMVRSVKNSVYPELRHDVLIDLKEHELLSLLSIARKLASQKATATTINESYDAYHVACEEFGIKPQSKSSFMKNIDHLTDAGLIGKMVVKVGRGKRGRHAEINLYDVPASVLIERITNILEAKHL